MNIKEITSKDVNNLAEIVMDVNYNKSFWRKYVAEYNNTSSFDFWRLHGLEYLQRKNIVYKDAEGIRKDCKKLSIHDKVIRQYLCKNPTLLTKHSLRNASAVSRAMDNFNEQRYAIKPDYGEDIKDMMKLVVKKNYLVLMDNDKGISIKLLYWKNHFDKVYLRGDTNIEDIDFRINIDPYAKVSYSAIDLELIRDPNDDGEIRNSFTAELITEYIEEVCKKYEQILPYITSMLYALGHLNTLKLHIPYLTFKNPKEVKRFDTELVKMTGKIRKLSNISPSIPENIYDEDFDPASPFD